MNYNATHEEVRALRLDRRRVSELLMRYPKVSNEEAQEILSFLRTGRQLEIGLLTSNQQLRPNLDAFMEEHGAHLRITLRDIVTLIGVIVGLLLVLGLAWKAVA